MFSGKLEVVASLPLGGLGPDQSKPAVVNWTRANSMPDVLLWTAIIGLPIVLLIRIIRNAARGKSRLRR